MTDILSKACNWAKAEVTKAVSWYKGTAFGEDIDAAAEAAKDELESILPADLEKIAATTATAMLPSLVSGNYAAAIAAGVTTAQTEFKTAEAQVSSSTLSTFATIVAQKAQTAAAPAAVSSAST